MLTLPSHAKVPAFKAAAPGGVLQDNFQNVTGTVNLGGRVADNGGVNDGWTWINFGGNPNAFECTDVTSPPGLTALNGGNEDQFYVDAGSADHFSELVFAPAISTLVRQRGLLLRANAASPTTCFFSELRNATANSHRLYKYVAGVQTVAHYWTHIAIPAGATVRCSAVGNIFTLWVNGALQETYDASADITATPELGTNQRIGLFADNYIGSGVRAVSWRGGTGDGS